MNEKEKEPEPGKELSPMEILVKAAKVMNPKQFELPREMKIPCNFPGTEKGTLLLYLRSCQFSSNLTLYLSFVCLCRLWPAFSTYMYVLTQMVNPRVV